MKFGSVLLALAAIAGPARAGVVEPSDRADDAFDFMNLLNRHGLHDLNDEEWNAYGQVTWISSFKLPFHALYTNLDGSSNSLTPGFEHSFTGTATIYAGAKLWRGAELLASPELISEQPLSNLRGLGGVIQNFELQKGGTPTPTLYIARAYLQQTFDLGGRVDAVVSNPQTLAKRQDSRRVVLSVGRFSALDFVDKNTYSGDLRRQLFNMAFMTYAAYDFGADTRGYTWGAFAEWYWDDWALRAGRVLGPKRPNQYALDFAFWSHYSDTVELEHDHAIAGQPGAVRVLAYHDRFKMGRFEDALIAWSGDPTMNAAECGALTDYASTNSNAPDLCWVRKDNDKWGVGINAEQQVTNDIGVFLRAMYADGGSEVYAFTPTDRSLSFGALARGRRWCRKDDYVGVGFAAGGISDEHAKYLSVGGIDGFIGDGKLRASTETATEAFYAANLSSSIWLSGDYQFIVHPAFNADRGPVHIFGARFHAEF